MAETLRRRNETVDAKEWMHNEIAQLDPLLARIRQTGRCEKYLSAHLREQDLVMVVNCDNFDRIYEVRRDGRITVLRNRR